MPASVPAGAEQPAPPQPQTANISPEPTISAKQAREAEDASQTGLAKGKILIKVA